MERTRQRFAVIVAAVVALIGGTVVPAHAAAFKSDQAPLPANCPKGANPNSGPSNAIGGAYGEPTNDYFNGGVLTDSGNIGQATATNVTASLCGNLHVPWYPQVADPVPGAPPIDPARVEVGGVAPPDNANGTSDASLTTTYPGLGATVAVYFVGPTTLVVRQGPRPNGAIDADASTQLVAKATVTLFGQSTPVTCWIGGGPGSSTTAEGTKVPASPANVYLATTTPANFTPPGGQNSGPFTGPLGAARSVLVAQPFTLQSESCRPDLNLPITGSLVSTRLQPAAQSQRRPTQRRVEHAAFYRLAAVMTESVDEPGSTGRVGERKPRTLRTGMASLLCAALGLGVVSCGSAGDKAGQATLKSVKPSGWSVPAVAGGPSVANFCTDLRSEVGHLVQFQQGAAGKASPYQQKQIVVDFQAAVPKVVGQAPADIARVANSYLTQIGQLLAVVAVSKDASRSPKDMPPDVTHHPISQQQIDGFSSYVAANCHFQVTDPNTAAAVP